MRLFCCCTCNFVDFVEEYDDRYDGANFEFFPPPPADILRVPTYAAVAVLDPVQTTTVVPDDPQRPEPGSHLGPSAAAANAEIDDERFDTPLKNNRPVFNRDQLLTELNTAFVLRIFISILCFSG